MLSPLAPRLSPRAAFTLIEILVVLIIILILMGIVFAVYADALTNARVEATRATIRTLDSALQERQEAFQRLNLTSQAQRFKAMYDRAVADNQNPPLTVPFPAAEMIVFKDRFRAAFPQRLEDLWGFDGAPGGGDDAPLWTVWKRTNTLNPTDMNPRPSMLPAVLDRESSELLYLALTQGGSFGLPSQGLDSLNPDHLKDAPVDHDGNGVIDAGDDIDGDGQPDGNGLLEIVDDWGNPLRFYTWPTRLVRPGGDVAVAAGGSGVAGINIPFYNATAARFFTGVPAPAPALSTSLPFMEHWYYAHPLNQDPQDPTSILAITRDAEDINRNGSFDTSTPPPPYADAGEDFNNDMNFQNAGVFAAPFFLDLTPFNNTPGPNYLTCRPVDEFHYHTLNTYHAPLIVSAGPDGHTGLYEPDGRDPHNPGVAPTTPDFPRRLAQPLAGSTSDREVDELNDNVSNRRR